MTDTISSCHNAPVSVVSGGEGTSYWRCGTCHRPCDPKFPSTKEIIDFQSGFVKTNALTDREGEYDF